jgi:uncharacterized protein (TIGR03437 family)
MMSQKFYQKRLIGYLKFEKENRLLVNPFTALTLCLLFVCFARDAFTQTVNVSYAYDRLNRLEKVIYSSGAEVIYAYDSAGNRISVRVSGVEFKADVTPRPSGKKNGTISLLDWVQVGRFAVGLDTPTNASERQRADCHPRSTFGDNKLDIFDWVQAGRFFVGLDDLVPALASTATNSTLAQADDGNQTITGQKAGASELHTVRANSAVFRREQVNEVRIELDARGDENALAFSLNYDPALLRFSEAIPSGAGESQLIVIPDAKGSGRVGIGFALPPGQTFAAGTRTVVTLRFLALPGSGKATTRVSFGGLPTSAGISNAEAMPLAARFNDAVVTIAGEQNQSPALAEINPNAARTGGPGVFITIKGSNFVQGATVEWNGASRKTQFLSSTQLIAEIPASDLTAAGTARITVTNPSPGGGVSNALNFSIEGGTVAVRRVRAVPVTAMPGGTVTIPIEIAAQGQENAVSLSLRFDPAVLKSPKISLGGDADGGQLIANMEQAEIGRLGIAVALPIGHRLAAGTRQILRVGFTVASETNANSTAIELADIPLQRAVADQAANELATSWASGEVTINRQVMTVSAANYDGSTVAEGAIVAAFGSKLATGAEAAATSPLPQALAGTSVKVKDSAGIERTGALFFVSPGQINFQIPPGTAPGKAELTITNAEGTISTGVLEIEKVTPGLFSADASGKGWGAAVVLRIRADGAQSYEPIVDYNTATRQFIPRPIDLGPASDQVYLVLFGTGIRNRTAVSAVKANVGGNEAPVLYAGEQNDFTGLDQINVRLPRSLAGRGDVEIKLMVDGRPANAVKAHIK